MKQKKSYVVDVYCSIDKRSHKIFGVDEKHSLELAQKFFKERYKNYKIKSKDIWEIYRCGNWDLVVEIWLNKVR